MIWTADLAYVVGLLVTDGCLSKDGRHIDLTSKDIEQIQNFIHILNLNCKITHKNSSTSNNIYYRAQFSNVKLYRFLVEIGLTPAKSKTIGSIDIPRKFFIDYLRGCIDGDGYTYSYWDPRWKNSFMLYTGFVSASLRHLIWLKETIEHYYGIKGHIKSSARAYNLVFGKKASVILLQKIYYRNDLICLKRKLFKVQQALDIIR